MTQNITETLSEECPQEKNQIFTSTKNKLPETDNRLIIDINPDIIFIYDHKIKILNLFHSKELCDHIEENNIKIIIFYTPDIMYQLSSIYLLLLKLHKTKIKVISASSSQKNLIESIAFKANSTFILPPPINESKFQFNIDNYTIHKTKPRLCYLGRISPCKNISFMLDIISKISKEYDFDFFIYGGHDNIYNRGQLPYRNVVDGHKNINPHVSPEEIPSILSSMHLLISCSTFPIEDFGMSLAEGVANGIDIISTPWGGYADYIKYEGVSHFFNKQDAYTKIKNSIINIQEKIKKPETHKAYVDERMNRSLRNSSKMNYKSYVDQLTKIIDSDIETKIDHDKFSLKKAYKNLKKDPPYPEEIFKCYLNNYDANEIDIEKFQLR